LETSRLRGRTESLVIDLEIPKQVIASRLSITPETLSRILRAMANEGIITIHGRTLGVHDIWRLREFGRNERALYTSLQK
jgi:CRP-like cAMP-binding protein